MEETDALGGVTSRRYDLAGNMLGLRNPNGEEYRFTRDAEGRILSQTGLDGVRDEYTLDALGLPVHIRLAAGTDSESVVTYERDRLGRTLRRTGDAYTVAHQYTPGGHLVHLEKIDAHGQKTNEISRSYDSMGALVEEKSLVALFGGGVAERILRHEYDLAGNRVRSVLPGGEIVEVTPCDCGYIHQISFAASADAPERIISAFERDALHRETLRTQGRLHAKREYDPLSRVTSMYAGGYAYEKQVNALGVPLAVTPLVSKYFNYNANGELLKSQDVFSGMQHYTYDTLGRVTSASRQWQYAALPNEGIETQRNSLSGFMEEGFQYDRAGNLYSPEPDGRGLSDMGYSSLDRYRAGKEEGLRHNRLTHLNGFTFTYDVRGRVVKKSCAETGAVWTYAYNSDNQLIEAKAAAGGVTRFDYDALGRRTVTSDGQSETLFIWDGLRLLREERSGKATTYFYEQGSYAPLARVDGGADGSGQESVYYYHCNPTGLPEDVTDSEGNIVWRGRYSTWGKLVYEHTTRYTPDGFTQPLRMQGQYDDGNTGLYYNTFRYYDADAGRFSSEDPIGLNGGDNLYKYAANPLKWADPLGLLTVYAGIGASAFTADPVEVVTGKPSGLTGSATGAADVIIYSPESGWFAANSTTHGSDTKGANLGCGAGFGPELGFFTGNLADFEGTTHNTVISLLLINITYGENDAGDWGLGVSAGKGFGLGMYQYDSDTNAANWKEILK